MSPSKTQVSAAIRVVSAVAETIREVGEAPAGVVYAALASHGCTMTQFESILGILTGAAVIERRGDLLRWVA